MQGPASVTSTIPVVSFHPCCEDSSKCRIQCAGTMVRATAKRTIEGSVCLQATVYIYELVDDEVKVDKVDFTKNSA